jgi:hypothetical protein
MRRSRARLPGGPSAGVHADGPAQGVGDAQAPRRMRTCRRCARRCARPGGRSAPTIVAATTPTAIDASVAAVPDPMNHGTTGSAAPTANEGTRPGPPARGWPACRVGRRAPPARTLSAVAGSRITASAASCAARPARPADVEAGQLGRLGLGMAGELPPFDVELPADELVLRGDRHPLARAMLIAPPAAWPARPGGRRSCRPEPAKPRMSEMLETSPSLTPNTAAGPGHRRWTGARGGRRRRCVEHR